MSNHENILEIWAKKFKYIMVDEYQDTNFVQYKLVELLGSNNKNVCVVGDSDKVYMHLEGLILEILLNLKKIL